MKNIFLLLVLTFLLHPIFSQSESEEDQDENRKKYIETARRSVVIKNNFEEYYDKFHYPIAFPELRPFVFNFEIPYKKMVERHFHEPVKYESCFNPIISSFVRKQTAQEKAMAQNYIDMANAECSRRNQEIAFKKLAEIREDEVQKDWRRSNCKNPDILALIDFTNYLHKDDRLYRACVQLKEPMEEVNFIRSSKIKIFDLIREPVLEYPTEFKNLSEQENKYFQNIYKLSIQLLVEYGNFETYYESLPKIENPLYINHDLIFEVIYPGDRYDKIRSLYETLKNHKLSLLIGELYRGKERGTELFNENKKLLTEIKIANAKIIENKQITLNNKNQFKQLLQCLESFSEKHLERISLSYYSGLFKKYSIPEFSPTNKESVSKEIFEILNLYNKNLYNSKLLDLRLINRLQNCDMLTRLPYEEVSFPKILKDSCELNENSRKACEVFQ